MDRNGEEAQINHGSFKVWISFTSITLHGKLKKTVTFNLQNSAIIKYNENKEPSNNKNAPKQNNKRNKHRNQWKLAIRHFKKFLFLKVVTPTEI